MPTAYIQMTNSSCLRENYRAELCRGITKAISETTGLPAKLVRTFIVEHQPSDTSCDDNSEGASIAVHVFAHAGRTNDVKQAIGQEITNLAVGLGFPLKNVMYDFFDNPSGATFVGGSIRWAINDPRSDS